MTTQVFSSIAVGLVVSAILFLPLVVWQYRRYGRFDALRMVWTTAGFIYAAAIVAFTVFPLPQFTAGFCEANATEPVLDPLRFPRELIELVQAKGLTAVARDWLVWEVALNMVLFIPFGLIVRRLFEWRRGVVLVAALATSVLIELTQATGNWGLAPCPYRFADVTDLITNTTGALIGIALEKVTPRLLSSKAHLLAHRDRARPVTRGRRYLGMLLDAWYLGVAAAVGATVGAVGYLLVHSMVLSADDPGRFTPDDSLLLQSFILRGAWLVVMVAVVMPSLVGTGASLGQRTVYLAPVPRGGARWRLVVRALVVQGAVATGLLLLGLPWGLLTPMWVMVALWSVLVSPRGLSHVLAGCDLRDARADVRRERNAAPRE